MAVRSCSAGEFGQPLCEHLGLNQVFFLPDEKRQRQFVTERISTPPLDPDVVVRQADPEVFARRFLSSFPEDRPRRSQMPLPERSGLTSRQGQ